MSHHRHQSGVIPSMEAQSEELSGNTVVIVLGASGDLAKKKTFPAFFGLYKEGYLPKDIHIVGYARTKMTLDEFHLREVSYIKNPNEDEEIKTKLESFKSISTYVAGSYDKDEDFQALEKHLNEIEAKYPGEERNRLFYFALPPSVFLDVARGLKHNNYSKNGINRIIIEKPFGKDLKSAQELMSSLGNLWTEDETYRIDHYLGKEMVKNMLVLRFANIALSSGWDKNSISNVQITFKEPFGTEGRGGYFDEFVCPTFAAVTLWINNPRWEGVPFILKAGKALNEAKVEVRIQYKDVTQGIFKDIARNELVIRIQPSEAVYIKMNMKTPGFLTRAFPTEMDLTYKRRFTDAKIPEAYEALIRDAFRGDHSNFVRNDELEAAWKIFTPILHWIDGRDGQAPRPSPYPYGSRGPKELDGFIRKHGFKRAESGYVWPLTNVGSV
ncbi:Glucose-6-phosphate 1-dehydrogenase [Tulasnella sp. 403]|nr:Glucose-6-phosphate 1-dehydrogenase [Tulasnella sp. 403]